MIHDQIDFLVRLSNTVVCVNWFLEKIFKAIYFLKILFKQIQFKAPIVKLKKVLENHCCEELSIYKLILINELPTALHSDPVID